MVNINLNTLISCSSTNDLAYQGALDGLDEGNSFLSHSQTKGRGRNDNKWTSLKGNLFLSTIIRPKTEKKNWQQLSLIVAFSVIEVLLKFGIKKNQIELKWPNDILVNNKKIAGILLESSHDFIIAGIGLNVKKTPKNEEKWKEQAKENLQKDPLENLCKLLEKLVILGDENRFLKNRVDFLERQDELQRIIIRSTFVGQRREKKTLANAVSLDQAGGRSDRRRRRLWRRILLQHF